MVSRHITLLDTHIWIWLINGTEGGLRDDALTEIRRASAAGTLAIAAISVWEVAMLVSKGRIQLQRDCLSWVQEAMTRAHIHLIPLSPEIAVESTRLPGDLHGDPSDRIIVATARHENALLITRDRLLLGYGARGFVQVLEA